MLREQASAIAARVTSQECRGGEIAATGRFKIAGANEPADAEVQLTVISWGFSLTQGFSSVEYPIIGVNGAMKRGDEWVWQYKQTITAVNGENVYGYTPLSYRTEPEVLRGALMGIAKIVDGYLVRDLAE